MSNLLGRCPLSCLCEQRLLCAFLLGAAYAHITASFGKAEGFLRKLRRRDTAESGAGSGDQAELYTAVFAHRRALTRKELRIAP